VVILRCGGDILRSIELSQLTVPGRHAQPTVVFLATTFAKAGQEVAAAIDTKGIERGTPQIIGECTKAPEASFWSRLKDKWKRSKVRQKSSDARAQHLIGGSVTESHSHRRWQHWLLAGVRNADGR
jgi:hypothetical protein